MLHSLFMFSVFRSSPLQKSVKQRKPKAAIKGVCHRFSKSVSVDGQKSADKNWSVQSNNIAIPFTRTEISHRSCSPSSLTLWNSLDEYVRTIDSLKCFKNHIKNSYITMYHMRSTDARTG